MRPILRRLPTRLAAGLVLLLALPSGTLRAQGGPPMITDDPGTAPWRHFELNLAFTSETHAGASRYEAPLFDLNYGLGSHLQLKLEAPFLVLNTPGAARRTGLGDVGVGLKWRFLDQQGARGLDVSTYPQVSALTRLDADPGAGTHRPVEVLLPLQVQHAFGAFSVNADVGYSWSEAEQALSTGLVVGQEVDARTEVMAEAHQTSLRTTGEHERFVNVGLRHAFTPHVTFMGSVGHSFGETAGAPGTWISYVGLQLVR